MRGEVDLRIEGLMPEKLAERATAAGVVFERLRFVPPHTIFVEVSERDAKTLTALCKRFSLPVKVLRRRGKSALRRYLAARWTLFPALLLAAVLCWLFLSRIWQIDVQFTGNAASVGHEEELRHALEDMGVSVGISNRLDTDRLSDELLARTEGYSYIGVRREGIWLTVEAAPEVPAPEVYDVAAPRDLVSDRYGIVVSVTVESGEACVHVGDVVQSGQRLIRGAERNNSEDKHAIAALGEVVVRTWVEGMAEGHLTRERVEYTGSRSVSAWVVSPWLTLPIAEGKTYAQQVVETEVLPIGGLYLPIKLLRETAMETVTRREAVDEAKLTQQLTALAYADARAVLAQVIRGDYSIAKTWTTATRVEKDILRVKAVYEIELNAAIPDDRPQSEE